MKSLRLKILSGFGIISLVVARIIVNPILQVINRLQMVAGGDLSGQAMATKSKDEVGILVHTMNNMVSTLRQLYGRGTTGTCREVQSLVC